MSRIIVAPDSFKGSLTAKQVAQIISTQLRKRLPDSEIIEIPLADGGEGTKAILAPFTPDTVCLIETAQLIGLNLPEMSSTHVMQRGSDRLGRVIVAGLDVGKRDFVIALGGSATNDCGLGMLMALGMRAFDEDGVIVDSNLCGLLTVKSIDISALDPRLAESRLTVLTDVISPLAGENGATAIYGPQKGVQTDDLDRVDRVINDFAGLCGDAFGFSCASQEGAGAAGGLGFALILLDGKVVSGAKYVMDKTGFHHALNNADWVITGEGCSDAQTLQGKLPLKVAQAARSAGAKVALVSGSLDQGILLELENEFDLLISAKHGGISVDQALQQAEELLKQATERFISASYSSLLF